MSIAAPFTDVEDVVKGWLLTTAVAPLLQRPDGGYSIFKAMPLSAPIPALVLSRIGGGPRFRDDQPLDTARISCDCWAGTRDEAALIAGTLAAEMVNLSETGGYTSGADILYVAEVIGWVWLPDPQADTPRFIVDALFTSTTAP